MLRIGNFVLINVNRLNQYSDDVSEYCTVCRRSIAVVHATDFPNRSGFSICRTRVGCLIAVNDKL